MGRIGGILRRLGGVLGGPGVSLADFECSRGSLGRVLGDSWGCLGRLLGRLGGVLGSDLGLSWGILGVLAGVIRPLGST